MTNAPCFSLSLPMQGGRGCSGRPVPGTWHTHSSATLPPLTSWSRLGKHGEFCFRFPCQADFSGNFFFFFGEVFFFF